MRIKFNSFDFVYKIRIFYTSKTPLMYNGSPIELAILSNFNFLFLKKKPLIPLLFILFASQNSNKKLKFENEL